MKNSSYVLRYLSEVAKESHAKANKHLRRIKALYNFGIERKLFIYNPTVKKTIKYIPPQEDIFKILALAKEIDRFYLLMLVHTLAGVREVNNLRLEDVHEKYLTLWTQKSKHSDLTPRDIPLNEVLKEVIKKLPKSGEYVFMDSRTKTKYDYRKKFLKTLCNKAGVKEFTFHCLRHFGASTLSSTGAGTGDIQGILGYSQASTTDLYIQSLKTGMIDAMKKLEVVK